MVRVYLMMFAILFSINSFALDLDLEMDLSRTWPTANYSNDPGANPSHIFGVYKPVKGYQDPDMNVALKLASPLSEQRFESYDVVVLININSVKDDLAPTKGQTIRVYVRPEVIAKIGVEQFTNTTYDAATGLLYYWKTSTARAGKVTPRGYYRPEAFSSDHKSSIYNNSPMPWAVFFNGSIASHGTGHVDHLGQIASAGCARLEPQRAEDLFNLIGLTGKDWVDQIDRNGNLVYSAGKIVQAQHYKTVIAVR
ncbi:MAG: L,D-transpeptidase [Bdellovibrionota bacterium]